MLELRIISKDRELRFGVQVQPGPLSHVVRQTILCEKNGLDSAWYPDHFVGGSPHLVWPELFTTLTLMGINTSRVVIGSAATDSLRRHPATIAQSVATIGNAVGGRIILGIGAGEAMNLVPYGISMQNLYRKLREAIQIIKLLWASDPIKPAKFKGEFYSLKGAFLQIKPVGNPHPPIYVGGFGPKMLHMTGELADGWMPFSLTPKVYKKWLEGPIRKGAESAGRSLSDIEPAFLPATVISKNRDQAKNEIERVAKRFLVMLPDVLGTVTPEVKHPGSAYTLVHWMGRLRKKDKEIISQAADHIPTDVALRTVIWGTPDDCIEQIEKFAEAGCRHFIFGIRSKEPDEMIQLLGKEVVPYFRDQ